MFGTHLLDHLDPAPNLLVLGDLILDRYTWGEAERVSPEAPVLVLRAENREARLGGAASTALLARALEANVDLAGVVGDDPNAETLRALLSQSRVNADLVLSDPHRPTTVKERLLGHAGSRLACQVLRVDDESRRPLDPGLAERLAAAVADRLGRYRAVLISDYNKGVCTPGLLARLIAAARRQGVPVLVDPARIADYARYRGATLLKPNRVEAALATGRPIDTPQSALDAAGDLCRRLAADAVMITLEADGIALASADAARRLIPAAPASVRDVTGAGDMVLATLGLAAASSLPWPDAARLAASAAALQIGQLGVAPVTRPQLRNMEAVPHAPPPSPLAPPPTPLPCKLLTLDQLTTLAAAYRRQHKTIVLTNGCFDLLHVGHVTYLQQAAALGDVLLVAVNSDSSVRALKGAGRPIIPQESRITMLAALACVDHVVPFDAATPHEVLRRVRPDVLVKGGTYAPEDVVGREVVESYGGRVHVTGEVPNISSTKLLAAIRGAAVTDDRSKIPGGQKVVLHSCGNRLS